MKIIKYDTEKYPFSQIVREIYDVPLEDLDSVDKKKNLALGEDTHTPFHKVFYKKIDSGWPEFENLYKSFLRDVIFSLFKDNTLIYQKYPNIRFHRPDAKAVYLWHCDGDKDHKHPPGEINIFLPITKCYGTNTIWTETLPGFGDFQPREMEYGECLIAYLNQTRHGNKINETDMTRVSFDFRVVPGFAYDENFTGTTATTGKSFKVGEYYDKMTREES
jgi:hypothetical protein|tara:strand:+ start:221 stop:877 length:657 start_codon:yes stop_codon:yes gene_type:complete